MNYCYQSMKTLLISALIIFFAGSCFPQQITRRTLIEEFTSSSSDQAATSDPIINQLEGEAPGRFCIIKWYTPWGTKGGTNSFYNNYTLATTRSQGYYNNDTVVRLFLNGGAEVDPYRMPLDSLRSKVANEYKKTSPFIMDITQEIIGDSLIAKVTVRSVDTSYDLSPLSIGLVMIERFNQTSDINHSPYHTNIVRGVLHSLDAKNGAFRDALPFAYEMQGQKVHTFRFAGKIGTSWDRYGLASVAIIQNNLTKEVLQCNWTVPELQFLRPTGNTFPLLRGTTPCQFQLRNMTDSDFTVYPQLAQTSPAEWNLKLSGMDYPNFVLKAHSAATGTFVSESQIPLRGSGNFSLLLFTQPGIVVASIAGTIVGSDSRDLIIKNWTSSVYPSDPDIMKWKEFGLDAAIVNEDAIGDLYANDLRRFRTLYIQRANYGDSAELESIKAFIDRGGRMIFQSNKVLDYYSKSIVDTSVNKYAVKFKNIFHFLV